MGAGGRPSAVRPPPPRFVALSPLLPAVTLVWRSRPRILSPAAPLPLPDGQIPTNVICCARSLPPPLSHLSSVPTPPSPPSLSPNARLHLYPIPSFFPHVSAQPLIMAGRFHDPTLAAHLEASLVNSELTLHTAVAIGRAVARAGDRVEALAAAAAAASAAVAAGAPAGNAAAAPRGHDAAATHTAAASAAAADAATVAEDAEECLRELLALAPGKTDPTDTLAQVAKVRAQVAAAAVALASALTQGAPDGRRGAMNVRLGGAAASLGRGRSSGGGSSHAPNGAWGDGGPGGGGGGNGSDAHGRVDPEIGAHHGWGGDANAGADLEPSDGGGGGRGGVRGAGGVGYGGRRDGGAAMVPGKGSRPWDVFQLWQRAPPAARPKRQDGGGHRGLSAPFVRQVTQSVVLASSITWMLSLLGVVGGLIGLSLAYAESQRNPVLVRDVVVHPTLPLPVITMCTSILGVPAFSNYPTDEFPGQPLFTARSVGDASGAMAVYPESLDVVEELAIGPANADCSAARALRYMDAAVLNRMTGVPSMEGGRSAPLGPPPAGGVGAPVNLSAGKPFPGLGLGKADRTVAEEAGLCGACFRLGSAPQIVLNGTAAAVGKDVVAQVELVTANVLESCIVKPMDAPLERVLTLVSQLWKYSAGLQREGVLDYDGADPTGGFIQLVAGDEWDIYKWLRPPAYDTDVELQVLGAKSSYVDFLCNVYLFSGFFYPAPPGTSIRFTLDWRGTSYPKWRKSGDGPYFQTQSLLRTAVTQSRSTQEDSWLVDLNSPLGLPPAGSAPRPHIDEDNYPVWRHAQLGPIYAHFVGVYVQEPAGGGRVAPVPPAGDGRGGDDDGRGRRLVPQPTPGLDDLVQRVESGSTIVRMRLKQRPGYGVDAQRYTATRVDRLLLAEANKFASAFNSSYSSWLLEFGLESFAVETFTARPSFGMSLYIADVFNVVGVFTGLSLYTLLVLPGTLLLARSVRARQRQLEES